MAASITVEDGSGLTTSNSYATEAEADTYHEEITYGSDWDDCSDKPAALIQATRLLDEHVDWSGTKNTKEQALRWPRSYVYDRDGYQVANDTIPQWLKNATSELARNLSAADRLSDPSTKGFKRLKMDTMELEVSVNDRPSAIPNSVWSIIRPYGKMYGRSKTLVRM